MSLPHLTSLQRSGAVLRVAAVAVSLTAVACQWGTRPATFAPALGPEGARVTLRLQAESADRRGELFAADTAGLIYYGDRVVWIAWQRVAWIDVEKLGSDYDVGRGNPGPTKSARLALVSRFPQGLSGGLLARVLAAFKQDSLDLIR